MLDFLRADILRFQLGQPRVQILTAASPPHVLRHINGRLAAESQCDGVARSGVDGARDSFVFEEDARIVGAALDVREDRSFHLDAEVLAETLDQIVAHRSWCRRCVQDTPDCFALRRSHPYHEVFRRVIGSCQNDDPGIRSRVFHNSVDCELYQRFGRLARVLFHTTIKIVGQESNFPKSSGFKFSSH